MENFTPITAAIGGAMIGLSAVWLMASAGRIAGISGILGGAITAGQAINYGAGHFYSDYWSARYVSDWLSQIY